MRLRDRVAVITGGGRGIGEAVALAFAREGASLVLAARTQSDLHQVQGRVGALGGKAQIVSADVSNQEDVLRITRTALDTYGQIDVLVNAAGVYGPIGPAWDVDVNEWVRAVHINLVGTFLCCHAVLPFMLRRRRGRIINFSGGGATSPLPRFSAYAASKAAIVRFSETLAEEVKDFNIHVNAVAPGAVDTRLQDQVLAAGERAGELFSRIRRLRETGEGGVPAELAADLVVFLASDESSGLTGKLIAAPYDDWRSWNAERIAEVTSAAWFTLRRIDPHTLRPFVDKLK